MQILGSEVQILGGEHQTLGGEYQTLGSEYQTLDDEVQTLSDEYQTLGGEYQTLSDEVLFSPRQGMRIKLHDIHVMCDFTLPQRLKSRLGEQNRLTPVRSSGHPLQVRVGGLRPCRRDFKR